MVSVARVRSAARYAGAAAVFVAIVVGAAGLLPARSTNPGPTEPSPSTAAAPFPLSAAQLDEVLRQPPDFAALTDPVRRSSCLVGLGYPAGTAVLGARPIERDGRAGVVLVLPDDSGTLTAVAVASTCSAADTGLLADTTVTRPGG